MLLYFLLPREKFEIHFWKLILEYCDDITEKITFSDV